MSELEGVDVARIISGLSHSPLVYFLKVGDRVKIGTSTNLQGRMSSLSLSLTDVLLVVPGGRDIEHEYHQRFNRQRISYDREWFNISGELRSFLQLHRQDAPSNTEDYPAPIPNSGYTTLTDACTRGILSLSIIAARKARQRDSRFPPPVRHSGNGRTATALYDIASLRQWEGSRIR